ncbi:YolD-like family protein [Staphylococcus arlettae]|uniref:YolD-like family protein n=1 Tax=Staphylococcus arlettae TaxID=29378 RepID=UPI0021D3BD9E|nr:YolD-like family protein [Staphylococcus arlettae]UXU48891.1 YolD-like family protein [Staphylococcus arlettae]
MKIINPNAPDEYKYETDYHEIPREYLNPRIPQGRGIVKWNAFKTLLEQYEQLEQYIQDQNKIDRPSLSDDQLQRLNETLVFKMFNDPHINVRYFSNGYIKEKEGVIHKVDPYTQTLHLYENKGIDKLDLKDIVEIK